MTTRDWPLDFLRDIEAVDPETEDGQLVTIGQARALREHIELLRAQLKAESDFWKQHGPGTDHAI